MKNITKKDEIILDTSGTECPIPVLKARRLAEELTKNVIIKVIATDPLAEADFQHYCNQSKFIYLGCEKNDEKIIIRYQFNKQT